MTTVAYRHGTIAADRGVANNGAKAGCATKIARVSSVHETLLIGASGSIFLARSFLLWAQSGMLRNDFPEVDSDNGMNGFIVRRGYGSSIEEIKVFMPGQPHGAILEAPFYAIGSGADFALGAMHQGADAIEAVRCVLEFDLHSFGGIQFATFNAAGIGTTESVI